jgi:four helix bundle protein
MKIESFKELDVWTLGREIKKKIFDLVKAFPKVEEYRLKDQLIRAAISVTANIEGFGRYHYQENIQYCRQARGSLYEIVDHLITAYDFGYIDEDALSRIKSAIKRNIKVLNSYIAMIQRRKELNT